MVHVVVSPKLSGMPRIMEGTKTSSTDDSILKYKAVHKLFSVAYSDYLGVL